MFFSEGELDFSAGRTGFFRRSNWIFAEGKHVYFFFFAKVELDFSIGRTGFYHSGWTEVFSRRK